MRLLLLGLLSIVWIGALAASSGAGELRETVPPTPIVENSRFVASLSPTTGALTVRDKSSGAVWQQCPTRGAAIANATASGRTIRFILNEAWTVEAELGESWIDITLDGDPEADFAPLDYPGGFTLRHSETQSLVLPNCAGMVIPFVMSQNEFLRDTIPGRTYQSMLNQAGLTMPWVGTSDGELASMVLQLTPWDGEFAVEALADGYIYFSRWLANKEKLGYARKARCYFLSQGGYVGLCKAYREYAKEQGYLVTLAEKRAANPDVDKLIGALSLWMTNKPNLEILKEMKEAGIEDALVSYHVGPEDFTREELERIGANLPREVVTREFAQEVQALGYLVGRTNEYRTIVPEYDGVDALGRTWKGLDVVHRVGYPEQCAIDKDGNIVGGFERGGHRCGPLQLEIGMLYLPPDQDSVGYNVQFIDTLLAVELFECYSEAHPVTRREDAEARLALMQYVTDYGPLFGTEGVAAWAVPALHYAEGPTSFARIYRPTYTARDVVKQPVELGERYWATVLNERLRAPLWQLVFHDAVVTTNRWNDVPNMFADLKAWEKVNLMNILHAQMPTFALYDDNWTEKKDMYVRTFNDVCKWNKMVGYEEMTDHNWLTPDGSVQETVYASGKRVIVNFGDEAFQTKAGDTVAAGGFRIEP